MTEFSARASRARPLRLVVVVQLWAQAAIAQVPTTPNLEHTKWQLVRFEARGGTIARPDDPGKYTIEFADRLMVHFDCATGSSTWKAPGGDLQIGKLEGAAKKCAQGSMADRILDDWRDIRSYSVRSDLLYLALKNGRGWYVFEPYAIGRLQGSLEERKASSSTASTAPNLQRYAEESAASSPFIAFDSKGVNFGPWLRQFIVQVRRSWYAVMPQAVMTFHGHTVMTFNVHKDGRITEVTVKEPSSIDSFNAAATSALLMSSPAAPVPAEYPDERVSFMMTFYYNERPPDAPATAPPK